MYFRFYSRNCECVPAVKHKPLMLAFLHDIDEVKSCEFVKEIILNLT